MTDAHAPSQPLGVGSLFTRSFALFFRHLPLFFLIGFVPALAMNALSLVMMGEMLAAQASGRMLSPAEVFTPGYWAFIAASMLLAFVLLGVYTLAAYDVSLGKPVTLGAYVGRTLASILPIAVLGILFSLMVAAGFALLVRPGLYILARFFVFTPAILVERAGFSALRRASQLSRGYRWPIVGALVLLGIVMGLLSAVFQLLVGFATAGSAGLFGYVVLQSIPNAIVYGLGAIFSALLYARLRELKEGLGMTELAEIFA